MDVKAFPFNYNRSQPGSPSASACGAEGSGEERFYRRSATVVRTSALKPPLKFAELFICPAPAASVFVPTSYRPLSFRRSLKFQGAFLPVHHPALLLPSFPFADGRIFLSRHLVKRFFCPSFWRFFVVLAKRERGGGGGGNQQKTFDLLDALPSIALPILRFSFRAPLIRDCPLLVRISVLPVFPILLRFVTYLCMAVECEWLRFDRQKLPRRMRD